MKVGLILHPYGEKYAAGLGRSILSLTRSIVEQDVKNDYVIFIKDNTSALDPLFKTKNYEVRRLKGGLFWLDRGLNDKAIDCFLFFTPFMPIFRKLKKSIVVVHDLGFLSIKTKDWKEKLSRIFLKLIQKRAILVADKIITVSAYTKEEVKKFVPVAADKITVIYNGFNDICEFGEENSEINKPYFVSVGVMKERKNPIRILKAFEEFKEKTGLPHQLVYVGKYSAGTLVDTIRASAHSKDIVLLDYVSEKKLCHIYRNAEALVYPSLLEGFGMPILEAMSCGTAVITSDIGAMKELGGGASILVDPYSASDIAKAMEIVGANSDLRKSLVEKGKKRAEQFSWVKAGTEYIKLIHQDNICSV